MPHTDVGFVFVVENVALIRPMVVAVVEEAADEMKLIVVKIALVVDLFLIGPTNCGPMPGSVPNWWWALLAQLQWMDPQ